MEKEPVMNFVKIMMTTFFFSGGSALAQINILCQAAERWTFKEEISRPVRWAFTTSVDGEGVQINRLEITGMPNGCNHYTEVYVNDEGIWFNCHQISPIGEKFVYFTRIDRLTGDFIIRSEWQYQSHLDGVTIGSCQNGMNLF